MRRAISLLTLTVPFVVRAPALADTLTGMVVKVADGDLGKQKPRTKAGSELLTDASTSVRQSFQKPLNLSGVSSVYLTVC